MQSKITAAARARARVLEEAWGWVVSGLHPQMVIGLTDAPKTAPARMKTVLRKLAEYAPAHDPVQMTWVEAQRVVEQAEPPTLSKQLREIAGTLRKLRGGRPIPPGVLAEAISMMAGNRRSTHSGTPAAPNVTRGVRHAESQARA